MAGALGRCGAALKQITERRVAPEEQALIDDLLAKRRAWQAKGDQFLEAVRNNGFSVATMQFLLLAGRTEGLAFERSLMALSAHQATKADLETAKAERNYRRNQMLFAALVLFGIPPIGAFLIAAMRRMSRGLEQAKRNVASISSGDLSQDIPPQSGQDKIAHLLTQLKLVPDNLRQLIRQVLAAAEAIASASAQVAGGTQDLSQRTEQQASSLEQTASATEEHNSTVRQNAASAQQAKQMADEASGVASRSGAVVAQVVGTMEQT